MGTVGTASKGSFASEEHNASVVVGGHSIDDSAGAIERSVQDDSPDLLPVLYRHLRERFMRTDRGIVDEDVNFAKFRQGLRHHPVNLIFLRYIGKDRERLAAECADLLSDRVGLGLIGAGVDDN